MGSPVFANLPALCLTPCRSFPSEAAVKLDHQIRKCEGDLEVGRPC